MSLYAVQDNVGNYWDFDNRGFHSPQNNARRNTTFNLALADAIVQMNGGHVAELFEAPAKVVVSEEEAEMLKKLDREIRTKSTGYSPWKWLSKLDDLGMAVEDAYKALAIGWTVEKHKRWNVRVPHSRFYYWKWKDDEIGVGSGEDDDVRGVEPYRFTDAEVEHYDLQDCEKVEVTDDDD